MLNVGSSSEFTLMLADHIIHKYGTMGVVITWYRIQKDVFFRTCLLP
jgi:hypothetical protein